MLLKTRGNKLVDDFDDEQFNIDIYLINPTIDISQYIDK